VTTPGHATQEVAGISPIYVGGDADPGGRDDVAATVAGSVAAAEARYGEHQRDTYEQGSTIGDLMDLPGVVSDGSRKTGRPDAGNFT
jgi:hypothetical protein